MSFKEKLRHEIKAILWTSGYFIVWFGVLMLIKVLLLKEYKIAFYGISAALIGALVVAKVLLVMEKIPLGSWIHSRPAFLEVILRTIMYGSGVFVVLLMEKAFDARVEYGGFFPSLQQAFAHADINHVYVTTICVTGALLGFNLLSVVCRHLGKGGLFRILLTPPVKEAREKQGEQAGKQSKPEI